MGRYGLASTLTLLMLLDVPGARAAPVSSPVLVAKAKHQKAKKKATPPTPEEEKPARPTQGGKASPTEPEPQVPPEEAPAAREPSTTPSGTPARRLAADPFIVALAGANTRTRWSDLDFADGSRHYAHNWFYPELSVRAWAQPWVARADALRGLIFDAEYAHSIGASVSSDTTGAGDFDISSWRLTANAGYLFDRLKGTDWDVGGQLGVGIDRYWIDPDNPDLIPSDRLVYLRFAALARHRLIDRRLLLDMAAGYHLLLATGLSGRGADYSDTSGDYGFDAGAGLSGEWGDGPIRWAYSLRLTYQRHAASISNSTATEFTQNDFFASLQLGASFR